MVFNWKLKLLAQHDDSNCTKSVWSHNDIRKFLMFTNEKENIQIK